MDMPKMYDLQLLTRVPVSSGAALISLTLKAIWTAVQAGNATSAAITVSTATEQDVNNLFQALQSAGLTVTNSGTTFTVGWGTVV